MSTIGERIKERRVLRGMTRDELGRLVGVTSQTILNLEQDPEYNLGTRLLRRLGGALSVEFTIQMKEIGMTTTDAESLSDRITMGNDEFILHLRKHYSSSMKNPQIGKRVWQWLRDNADGQKLDGEPTCIWGRDPAAVGETRLPVSATQFSFRTDALPDLYRFLGHLGTSGGAERDDE